jgi:hypothetical protein
MVCGGEIRAEVAQAVGVGAVPRGTARWNRPHFRCTYETPGGPVTLSVYDSTSGGRRYFDSLRTTLGRTWPIAGLAGFGLPSYEDRRGSVVFLKDGKVLDVDATRVRSNAVSSPKSRADAAYAIAAHVIGCWNE